MYTVARQREIPLSMEETWVRLTRPEHLGRWFADVERFAPGEPFRFAFGDGDAFEGHVVAWQEPDRLELEWRFLGVGPRFRIQLLVTPLSERSCEVTVIDRGSLTVEEVHSLREGWQDFLDRLARYAETGEPARYAWSQTIGVGALLADPPDEVPELGDVGWWRSVFGGARVELVPRGNGTRLLRVAEEGWQGAATQALVETRRVAEALAPGTYVGVTHEGWPRLPAERQVDERRRYAELWRQALQDLERKYR